MEVNSQKYVRTGDRVTVKKTNKKSVVHYLLNSENQLSFDEPFCRIKKILVDCGDKIEHLLPNEVIINQGR